MFYFPYVPPAQNARGLRHLSTLNKREITTLIRRISNRTRKDVEVMSQPHFRRTVMVVKRLAAYHTIAPMPKPIGAEVCGGVFLILILIMLFT